MARGKRCAGWRVRDPGLYFAAAVTNQGRFAGVVAVKLNVYNLRNCLAMTDAYVTDEFGVVVLADNPKLLMSAMPNEGLDRLNAEARERRYHRADFPALSLEPWIHTNLAPLILFNHETPPQLLFHEAVGKEGLEGASVGRASSSSRTRARPASPRARSRIARIASGASVSRKLA